MKGNKLPSTFCAIMCMYECIYVCMYVLVVRKGYANTNKANRNSGKAKLKVAKNAKKC